MLKRCSFHPKRAAGPVATSYWRWLNGDDTWVGYRLYSCIDDSKELLARMGWIVGDRLNVPDVLTCVSCGGEWSHTDREVYVWFFPPKQDAIDFEVPLCDGCFDRWLEIIRHNGTILLDRNQSARARPLDPWAGLIPPS